MKYCASCQSSYPLAYTSCPKDQSALQLVTDFMPGMVLRGKYEIVQKLGAGGMGSVYKVRHLVFGELRAVKFVSSHLAADEQVLARFRSEAVVARRLQHPNAVRVDDIDTTDDGQPYIVMEYVAGRSLRELFKEESDVSTKRILALAHQACAALGAAHALGLVHRDIKPDNLMVVAGADGKETLKVADFGLAKVREGFELAAGMAQTQTGFIVGTPPYMSPEQAIGAEVDGRSDLYSMGIVLYELFTGRLPFRADSPMSMLIHHRETIPPPPGSLGVPQPLSDFLMKALEKRPVDRFQTAEQMDDALRLLSLMPLPEFVGQGVHEGFDPQWTGSRHASRLTTLHGTVPPKVAGPAKFNARDTAPGATRVVKQPAQRSVPTIQPIRDPEPPSAGSSLWMGIGAVALVAAWFMFKGSAPEKGPVPAPSVEVATVPAASQSGQVPVTRSEPPERTDTEIRFDIERVLGNSSALRDAHIKVEVANGIATLAGDAPDQTAADLAAGLAGSVPGVRRVFGALRGPVPAQAVETNPLATSRAPAAIVAAPPEPTRAQPTPDREEDGNRERVHALLDSSRRKMESGDPNGAEADLKEVLKIDPNNSTAKDVLERLKHRPGPPPPPPRPTPV
ncbi:MAG: protein kinase [Vicinamibacteria bacterium]